MTQIVTLDQVCEFLDNQRKPVTAKDRRPGIYPYYGANGVQDHVDQYIFDDELVLLAEDGGFFDDPKRGVAYRVSGKCWVNNHAHVLKPKDNIDVDYLGFILRQYDVRPYITGAIVKKLNQGAARKMTIPLPALSEQKEIVRTLLCAEELQIKRKESINLLDQYLKSVFWEMFGDLDTNTHDWKVTTLSSVTKKVTDGTHQPPKFVNEGIPFIFISNIVNNEIILKTKKFISEDTYKVLTKSTPIEIGDILYTTVGSYGHPAIVKTSEKFCFQRHIAHIKPDTEKINTIFLYGMLKSPMVRHQADEKAKGIAQKTLNLTDLKNIKVIVPPVELQNKYADITLRVESVKKKMVIQSEELEKQFQALMQKAFN